MLNKNTQSESGIALISVALFIMVMGILMFSAIYVLKTQSIVKAEQKNNDHSIAIKKAIENFVAINNRYPCPSPITAAPDTAGYGVEAVIGGNCDGTALRQVVGSDGVTPAFIGTVPVRTLNIPEQMIADGNKQRYVFAMSGNMASSSTDPRYGQGVISILDTTGTSVTTPPNSAAYALISPGADKRGAYDINGIANSSACPTATVNADTHENCDFDDAVFISKSTKVSGNTVGDYTASVAFATNPTAHDWVINTWGACGPKLGGKRCFDGTQTRTISCSSRDGSITTDETKCSHSVKPPLTRDCDLGPCRWQAASCPPMSCWDLGTCCNVESRTQTRVRTYNCLRGRVGPHYVTNEERIVTRNADCSISTGSFYSTTLVRNDC